MQKYDPRQKNMVLANYEYWLIVICERWNSLDKERLIKNQQKFDERTTSQKWIIIDKSSSTEFILKTSTTWCKSKRNKMKEIHVEKV